MVTTALLRRTAVRLYVPSHDTAPFFQRNNRVQMVGHVDVFIHHDFVSRPPERCHSGTPIRTVLSGRVKNARQSPKNAKEQSLRPLPVQPVSSGQASLSLRPLREYITGTKHDTC